MKIVGCKNPRCTETPPFSTRARAGHNRGHLMRDGDYQLYICCEQGCRELENKTSLEDVINTIGIKGSNQTEDIQTLQDRIERHFSSAHGINSVQNAQKHLWEVWVTSNKDVSNPYPYQQDQKPEERSDKDHPNLQKITQLISTYHRISEMNTDDKTKELVGKFLNSNLRFA